MGGMGKVKLQKRIEWEIIHSETGLGEMLRLLRNSITGILLRKKNACLCQTRIFSGNRVASIHTLWKITLCMLTQYVTLIKVIGQFKHWSF